MTKFLFSFAFCALIAPNLYGQKFLSFSYSNSQYKNFATIDISKDAYKINGDFLNFLKIKGEKDSIYKISMDTDGKCKVLKQKLEFDKEFSFFSYIPIDTLLKTDTLYYKQDTLIHKLKCKKIELRYVIGGFDEESIKENKIIPIDTVRNILWITDIFKIASPFTFQSSIQTGLIIQSQTIRTEGGYLDNKGNVRKKWVIKPITTEMSYVDKDQIQYFSLPKHCILLTDEDDY